MKIGVVDAGGGFRGVYACGVLDYCLDNHISFDLGIGVSAGCANLASFIAGQRGRNHLFYTKYGLRKQYAGLGNFVWKKSFLDLDYAFSVLSNHDGEIPLDYPSLRDNPMEFLIVATDAGTGLVKYFDKGDIQQDEYDVFKASSSIPFVCKPCFVQEIPYYDGAPGDPVPVKKAFDMGCDRVVVLLTRPENIPRKSKRDKLVAALIRRKYPAAAEKLRQRAQRYNDSVALAQEYARQGKAVIIAPDDTCGVHTLSRNQAALQRLYEKGYDDGHRIKDFLDEYAGS